MKRKIYSVVDVGYQVSAIITKEMTRHVKRLLREATGSRREIAETVALTPQYLSSYLSEKFEVSNMSLSKMIDVVTALGYSIQIQTDSKTATVKVTKV